MAGTAADLGNPLDRQLLHGLNMQTVAWTAFVVLFAAQLAFSASSHHEKFALFSQEGSMGASTADVAYPMV